MYFTLLAVVFVNVLEHGASQPCKSCGQWTDLYSAAPVRILAIIICMAGHCVLPVSSFFPSFLSSNVNLGGYQMILNRTEPGSKMNVQNLGIAPHQGGARKLPIFGRFYGDVAPADCSVSFLTDF